ncbi:MAG: FAD-dependent oxidoreductase [Candidatus Hydrothermarchaeales archaeon]
MGGMEERELIIIGGGPAGLTAGIYGVRAELSVLVLEAQAPGGLIATAGLVENYPGFPDGIMGIDLAENMRKQAENAGVEIRSFEAVQKLEYRNKGFFITTSKTKYRAKAVVIATGLRHRKLGIPGETEYSGKGVSYCFTCDGPLYKGKEVVVVGGGTGAVEASLFIENIASRVTIVTKSDRVKTAEAILKTRLDKSGVNISLRTKPIEVIGAEVVKGLRVLDLDSNKERVIDADGIFIEIGMKPNTAFLDDLGVKMEKGFVAVDEYMRTNVEGLYAAGDVTVKSLKQLGIAVAQGSLALLDAYKYLKGLDV